MDPPLPVVAAPPAAAAAAAAAGGGNARRPAGCWWLPLVSQRAVARAQICMAVAAFAFALFASALKPATSAHLPPHCVSVTTATGAMELRYYAGLVLLSAAAQAGAAAAALVITPPSNLAGFLTCVSNLLGIGTLVHLFEVAPRVLSATGVFCLTGNVLTTELVLHRVLAYIFLSAVPFLGIFGKWVN